MANTYDLKAILYLTFCVAILSVCLLREAEARRWLNFLEAAGGEISGLKAGGKEVSSKEVGGKEVGSKEVSRFSADFITALL
jgi:hypothetical protein